MSCSEILTLPFTAGNLYTSTHGRTHHDGSISTVVVVTSALAYITVLISLKANSTSGHVILDPIVMRLSLTVVVAAGICSIMYLLKIAKKQETTVLYSKSSVCVHRLHLSVLWLFGLGVMLICILEISRLAFCVSEITRIVRSVEFGVDISYHVSRILLVGIELCFISYFSRVKFEHCLSTYYALLFIILANSSVWIYYYLALDGKASSEMPNVDNSTFIEINNTRSCYENSAIGAVTRQVNLILYPVNTEFSLLVLKFVLEMWSLERQESPGVAHRNSVMGVPETEEDGPRSDVDQILPSQHLNERSSLLDTHWEYRLHNNKQYTSFNETCPGSFYLAVFVAICIFLPLAVLYLVLEFRFQDNDAFFRTTAIYETLYRMVIIIAVLFTWVYLQKDCTPIAEHSSLKSKDYVLLLGTFGSATYFIHVVIASSLNRSHIGTINVVSTVISIASLYLQTTLLLQAKRYVPKPTIERKFPSFRSLCTVLSILNFGYWITDSFVGMEFQTVFTPKVEVFGSEYWMFIMSYVFPLVIFYRLESGFSFLKLYWDFSHENYVQ